MHVVVAGGGLAGLTAARRLAAAGADVELFEAEPRVGGRVRSRVVDGYTLDRGFQVLFTAYPAVREELDLAELDLRPFRPGATIARPDHRSTLGDPIGDPGVFLPTLLNRDVPVGDLFRLFRLRRELTEGDPAAIIDGERDGEATIERYLSDRGFSEAFLENFVEPFYGGITLDRTLSTSSRVFEYTFRMLSEGKTAVPADGMGAIPRQLRDRAEAAGVSIRTGHAVTAIEADDDELAVEVARNAEGEVDPLSLTGNQLVFPDAVLVATDPATAGELAGVATPTDKSGCVTVHVSIPDRQSLDTGSRILLNAADARPNTVAPMSAAAPEYAPEGRQLLSATFLGEQDEGDEELGAEVRSALSAWYPENDFGDLEVVGVDRVAFAQFRQPPGFRRSLPAVDDPDGPVYLAGDYTRWSSIQGALESGRRAARTILEDGP